MAELLQTAFLISMLAGMVRIATPLVLAAVGELVTERAGVLNLGVEGTMLLGALVGFLVTFHSGTLWLGTAAAILAGAITGLLMALMVCTLKVDQTITGLALNLLVVGLATYWYRLTFASTGTENPSTIPTYGQLRIPVLGDLPFVGEILFSQHWLTYAAWLAVPAVWLFLFRTRYGLELRGIGDNPRVLDMQGTNIAVRQYGAVVFGSVMSALGGAFLTQVSAGIFVPDISAGRGWIAIAIVVFGNWQPAILLVGALFFGLIDSIQLSLQAVGVDLPHQVLLGLPYLLTVAALIAYRSRSQRPLSLGLPYHRE